MLKFFKTTLAATALAISALALAPSANAVPTLNFDDLSQSGGTIAYSGSGGPLIGNQIIGLSSVTGSDTPLNNNVSLSCVNCVLSFSTGNYISGPSGIPPTWTFAGGGFFTLNGELETSTGTDIANGTLLDGSFSNNATIQLIGGSLFFTGAGIDTKHPALLAFYGLSSVTNFTFGTTDISVPNPTIEGGGFTGTVAETDIINFAQIPEPMTLLMLGMGLLSLGFIVRRRPISYRA
jgi:PEP-CTERM motif